ncbi:hypothetical protein V3G39_13730 [Dermatophilaceae bacterium Sec6.4]
MSTKGPRIGWTTDPTGGAVGMAHATYPRQTISLSGAETPFLCDPWPRAGQEWPTPYSRCPSATGPVAQVEAWTVVPGTRSGRSSDPFFDLSDTAVFAFA